MYKKFTLCIIVISSILCSTHLLAQDELVFKVNSPSTVSATYLHGESFTSSQRSSFADADKWGATMKAGQEVTGDIVVIRDESTVDTLAQHGCVLPLKAGLVLKDKIALIRRGTCGFSIKAYNAAFKNGAKAVIIYNNQPNVLISMLPTRPEADEVNVPCIFTTKEIGEALRNAAQGGQVVNVTLKVPAASFAHMSYNLSTPTKESQNNQAYIGLNLANGTNSDKLKVIMTASIVEPDGKKVLVRGGADTILANSSAYVLSDSVYKPTKIGQYQVTYTNTISADTLRDSFRITDFVFGEDRGTANGWAATDSASFIDGGLKFDVGHIYQTGVSADKMTHAAFALHNPASFPKNDEFVLILYPYTAAIQAKHNAGTLSYDDLSGTEVGFNIYKMKGTEKPDSLIFAEFSTPLALADNSRFLLMVRYDGTSAGTGIVPQFTSAGQHNNRLARVDAVVTYEATTFKRLYFYTGWSGGTKNIIRMYMQGFRTSLENNLPAWAENTINIFPNPVSNNILNIDFNLEKLNEDVSVTINDVMGRVLKTVKLKNVQNGTQNININELENGYYFAKIVGKDGWRTKVFSVAK
jgi:Secretion system C-terminal sorting domain/PA domain